jgi:hypothetical protein
MIEPIDCPKCGKAYRADKLKECPACASTDIPTNVSPRVEMAITARNQNNLTPEIELLRALIESQNRTTHAVRSLAITFVAAPIIASIVGIAISVAIHSGNATFVIIVGIVAVAILAGTLSVAINELKLSRRK